MKMWTPRFTSSPLFLSFSLSLLYSFGDFPSHCQPLASFIFARRARELFRATMLDDGRNMARHALRLNVSLKLFAFHAADDVEIKPLTHVRTRPQGYRVSRVFASLFSLSTQD